MACARRIYTSGWDHTSHKNFCEIFSGFGEVRDINLKLYDSKGVAFISYYDRRSALNAINAVKFLRALEPHVKVEVAKACTDEEKEDTVYIKCNTTGWTPSAVADVFSEEFGAVQRVNLDQGDVDVQFYDTRSAKRVLDCNGPTMSISMKRSKT